MRGALILLLLSSSGAGAEGLVAARTLRAHTVLAASDLQPDPKAVGAVTDAAQAIGLETRVTLYRGQPVRAADLAPAAMIERNQMVALIYATGLVTIRAEGRALGRAGPGEMIKVMNSASKLGVTGIVQGDGSVRVLAD